MRRLVLAAFVVSLTLSGCGNEGGSADIGCWTDDDVAARNDEGRPTQWDAPPNHVIDADVTYQAVLDTSEGEITWELLPEAAPVTVNNFVCLARAGYYDGTPFHRILDGFVIQGGDPTGTGSGGPGYTFADEPVNRDYERGTVAMANAGPNTNGSQFFVVLKNLKGQLPKNYTIFGEVTAGMEVVDAIAQTPVRRGRSGENSTPNEAITLERVEITES